MAMNMMSCFIIMMSRFIIFQEDKFLPQIILENTDGASSSNETRLAGGSLVAA
jgi:hypothetical protein